MDDHERDELLRAAVSALQVLAIVQIRRARLDADAAHHAGRFARQHLNNFYAEMDRVEGALPPLWTGP
jgi:hypothetical protein